MGRVLSLARLGKLNWSRIAKCQQVCSGLFSEAEFDFVVRRKCDAGQLGYPTWMATRQLPCPGDKDTASKFLL